MRNASLRIYSFHFRLTFRFASMTKSNNLALLVPWIYIIRISLSDMILGVCIYDNCQFLLKKNGTKRITRLRRQEIQTLHLSQLNGGIQTKRNPVCIPTKLRLSDRGSWGTEISSVVTWHFKVCDVHF